MYNYIDYVCTVKCNNLESFSFINNITPTLLVCISITLYCTETIVCFIVHELSMSFMHACLVCQLLCTRTGT